MQRENFSEKKQLEVFKNLLGRQNIAPSVERNDNDL